MEVAGARGQRHGRRNPARARVRSFPVAERWGWIWIWMGDPALADPGEIIDIFDKKLIVRTLDGSLLVEDYESEIELEPGMFLE